MKTVAIIAEYNPFHNGHAYQMEHIRQFLQADRIIVLMSGSFVQRGTPAIFDKYTRTQMALAGGADLVLELPVPFALGSAEFFATGAVSILHALGAVSCLHFGSECGNLPLLQGIADILLKEPAAYQAALQDNLKCGMSFPLARAKAFQAYACNHKDALLPDVSDAAYAETLSNPNNILGIEYLKAIKRLHSPIQPVTLCRKGADYHDQLLPEEQFPSASGLRKLYTSQPDLSLLQDYMPAAVWQALSDRQPTALFEDDFSQMLHYKLLTTPPDTLTDYQDISPDLAARIISQLPAFVSFTQFAALLKTKELTYSRICRCLCHILLDLKKTHYANHATPSKSVFDNSALYCRILGFRKQSTDLLKELKQTSTIPIISKLADASCYLSESALSLLYADLHAGDIYRAASTAKTKKTVPNEFRQEILRY